eukprot:4929-Rhodomonas_salina.1
MPKNFAVDPDTLPDHCDPKHVEEMQSILGSMTYMQVWTQPEISFSVNYLARYALRANPEVIKAERRILRYLSGTLHRGIRFSHNPQNELGKNAVK